MNILKDWEMESRWPLMSASYRTGEVEGKEDEERKGWRREEEEEDLSCITQLKS